jgi:O-antigen ligase
MTYVLAPKLEKSMARGRFETSIASHAHNSFLQTWFELGAVGALLLMMAGLGLLWQIRRLDPDLQPFAYAIFATAGPYLVASYGMWQIWYVALFGLIAVLFAIGQNAMASGNGASK